MSSLWKPNRRLFLTSGAALISAPAIVRAQTPILPGFPPGTFQSRAALDANGAATYLGPADINGAAVAWYGLRGYSTAYSTGSNPAIDVVDQAGANQLTVNILSNGNLDIASINTWVAANSVTTIKVKKLYDQSGSAYHVSQATLANMPSLVLSSVPGLGASKPAMLFAAASSQVLSGGGLGSAVPIPYTVSAVAEALSTATQYYLGSNTSQGCGFNINVANDVGFFNGGTLTQTSLSINNFYAIQSMCNNASSGLYINGTNSTGATGSTNIFNTNPSITVGKDVFGRFMDGYLDEVGVWANDKSANNSSINSQQRTYWGF